MKTDESFLRPLCPKHHETMIVRRPSYESASIGETIEAHGCECTVGGCSQMYSLSLGYFTTGINEDYWSTTRSPSLKVIRNGTQVICGEHKRAMFIEAFDGATKLERFRCPEDGCKRTMEIPSSCPPTYWLTSGYFDSPYID
jgi:hypothetical protein